MSGASSPSTSSLASSTRRIRPATSQNEARSRGTAGAATAPPSPPKKAKATTERPKLSTADREFCDFFRCGRSVTSLRQLDRLSLLACQRQGITVHDLLPVTTEAGPNADPAVAAARARRRTAKFNIVEQERRYLHHVVLGAAHVDHLTHEQHQLQTDLREQDATVGNDEEACESRAAMGSSSNPPSRRRSVSPGGHSPGTSSVHGTDAHGNRGVPLRCTDPEEDEDVAILLEHVPDLTGERSRLQNAIRATREKGDREVHKLRERQLRFIAHDIEVERQRQDILARIAEREKDHQRMQDRKRQALIDQARQEAKIQRRKMKALRIRNEVMQAARVQELEERAEKHDALWRDLVAKREEELEERKQQTLERDRLARERAERVRDREEQHCEELEEQYVDKVVTHEERKALVQTQLAIQREQRRLASLRKQGAAQQFVEKKAAQTFQQQHDVDGKQVAAVQRVKQQQKLRQQRLAEERARREEAAKLAAERREKENDRRVRRNISVLQREVEKEDVVADAKQRKRDHIVKLRELEDIKTEAHQDNMARLQRQRDHVQRQKDALLAEAEERELAQRRLKMEMSIKMQRARQRIAEDRERVQEQISRVRTSRGGILDKSPEDLLRSTSPDRSTPGAARRHASGTRGRPAAATSATTSPRAADGAKSSSSASQHQKRPDTAPTPAASSAARTPDAASSKAASEA